MIDKSQFAGRAYCAITRFGYSAPAPGLCAKSDLPALEALFKLCGFRHFTAREAVTPRDGMREKISALGYAEGMVFPPVEYLPRFLAVISMWDFGREYVAEPVTLRYVYRPVNVNAAAGGAEDSDHVHCLAADGEFKTIAGRDKFRERLERMQRDEAWLRISFGWKDGSRILHAGLLTDRGSRSWKY